MKYLSLIILSFLTACSNKANLAEKFPELILNCLNDADVELIAEGELIKTQENIFFKANKIINASDNHSLNSTIPINSFSEAMDLPPLGSNFIACFTADGVIKAMGSSIEN